MALNPRQARMLQTLLSKGILDKPNLGSMKAPQVTQAPLQNRKTDYASYLLSGALNDKGVGRAMSRALASNKSAEEEEQSMLTKLFDTMLIPNYTVANMAQSIGENLDDPLDAIAGVGKDILDAGTSISKEVFGRGLGKLPFIGDDIQEVFDKSPFQQEKRTFSDNLNDMGVKNKFARFGGGMALDIALDPLTYVGVGIPGRVKKAKDVLDEAAAIPEALLKPKQPNRTFHPATKQWETPKLAKPSVAQDALKGGTTSFFREEVPNLPRVNIPKQPELNPLSRQLMRRQDTPTGLTPAQLRVANQQPLPPEFGKDLTERLMRRQKDWERSMTKLGKVSEGTRLNMRSANEVVQQIAEGKVPRVLPKAPLAQGPAAERARDIADDVIDAMMGQKKNKGKKLTWRGPDGRIRNRKLPPELTAGMQISMANKIFTATEPKSIDEAIGLLKAAEDHMIALGVHPVRHEGVRVRLSDVFNLLKDKVEPEVIFNNFARKNMKDMDPAVRDAIQTVAAYRSATMADILENLTTYAEKAKRSVLDDYVGRQKTAAEAEIINSSLAQASKMGATEGELKAIKDLIKDVVNIDKLPVEKFYTEASKQLLKAVHEGRANPELIVKFNRMVANSYGYTAENLAAKISGNRVVDTFMGAFLTHWGKGHLFPKAKGLFDAGEQIARGRAEALRKMSQTYTKEEIANAWKVVTGNADEVVADARVLEMSNWFRGYFDEVLKVPSYAMKLENPATAHLSVAERQMTFMKDVNRHLKDMQGAKAFQFTNKNFQRDAWGVQRHFGNEHEGWLASWATQNPDDPLKFLYDIDLAMERASKEYVFLDNFVDVFGSLTKDPYHNFKMQSLDRIADFYVPEQIGRQMTRIMGDIHKGHWAPRTGLTQFYSRGLRIWKTSVTIYLPSHHIRNGIGDMYLMWLAGHNNPMAFKHAARIMHSQKGRYQAAIKSGDFQTIGQMSSPDAMKLAATQGKDVILNANGVKVTAEELYVNAFHRGLLKDANQLEDIFGESRIGIKPLGGKAHGVATGAAEYREHYIRLAHFTSAVNKALKKGRKDLTKIYDEAANEVRKWHPDGTDLTYFEEKYMRQLIPFYSWIRKSTPLLVESLITRPSKNLAFPRGMSALQNIMGIESTVADPFPDDQLFPEWVRETGIGPIGDPTSVNPFTAWWGKLGRNMINIEGDPYGYTMVNPGNPLVDQGRQLLGFGPRDTARGLFDSLTPFIKVPIEMGATGRDFTGAPIYKDEGGRGVLPYAMKQFGATAPIQRYLDIGEKDRVGVEPQGIDIPAILNNLFAAGIVGTGPYIKGAEFEEKAKARAREEGRK